MTATGNREGNSEGDGRQQGKTERGDSVGQGTQARATAGLEGIVTAKVTSRVSALADINGDSECAAAGKSEDDSEGHGQM